MMTSENGPLNEKRPKLLQVRANELQGLFTSNADIGHHIFAEVDLIRLTAQQSIFPGAIFRDCKIEGCDFSRSDFEGVRFERCKIVGSSFESCDIRSTLFADSEIVDCNFKGVYFSDNTIKGGGLQTTAFDQATMTGNQFIATRIKSITNIRSTMLHNDFLRSELEDTKFGNCTALYSYFEDCHLTRFVVNADSLGLSFGLTLLDLENANLTFLGRDEQKPIDPELVDQLIAEFDNRQWGLHSIIARLNFRRIEPLNGWSLLFEYLKTSIVGGGTKLDDISFALHVAERLAAAESLPFFPIVIAHDAFSEIVLDGDEITTEGRALQRLRSGLVSLVGSMQHRFLEGAAPLRELSGDAPVTLDLTFEERPESRVDEYIEYLVRQISTTSVPVRLLRSGPGSWHEIVQTVVLTAFALYTVLFLIEGSLIKLLMIKARLGQLTAPEVPKKFIEKAADPRQTVPSDLLKIMRPLIDGLSSGSLQPPEKKTGLKKKNLREIEVKKIRRGIAE